MKAPHTLRLLAALTLGVAATAVVASEEADDSGLSYDDKLQACAACHGENGDKPLAPDYPVLAGQYADYLEAALKAYKTGRRQHPIMSMQVEALGLTDSDITKLSAHFASKKGLRGLAE
ncbi:MAG: c-type cytochrome [Gammaproteobacteria bacterium]